LFRPPNVLERGQGPTLDPSYARVQPQGECPGQLRHSNTWDEYDSGLDSRIAVWTDVTSPVHSRQVAAWRIIRTRHNEFPTDQEASSACVRGTAHPMSSASVRSPPATPRMQLANRLASAQTLFALCCQHAGGHVSCHCVAQPSCCSHLTSVGGWRLRRMVGSSVGQRAPPSASRSAP